MSSYKQKYIEFLIACERGDSSKILMMLNENDFKYDHSIDGGYTCLMRAIDSCKYDSVKALINNKLDVNYKEPNLGSCALDNACAVKNINILQLLIDSGAEINVRDKNGYPPILQAIILDNTHICEILIENDAQLIFESHPKFSALETAINWNRTEIVTLIQEKLKNNLI